jgi:hypothetical protein
MTGVNVAMMQREWRSRYHLYRPTEQTRKQCKCHNYQKYPLPQCCDHKTLPLDSLTRATFARVFKRAIFARLMIQVERERKKLAIFKFSIYNRHIK